MRQRPTRVPKAAALACVLLVMPFVLGAGPNVSITVEVERESVRTDDNGLPVVERTPVQIARPGEVLVYTVRAQNHGDTAAMRPRIQDPIPDGTVLLLEGFDFGRHPNGASVDGGRTWQSFPAQVVETTADGAERSVPAPAEAYTHLRWVLDGELGPGEARDVSFKVRVL
jgi:uncharacterized repeat protein (TIGR01451 family)